MSTNQNSKNELPHMGTLVRNKINEKKITYAEACRRIGIKQPTISNYFEQNSLQTRIIWKLCHALDYNFFADIISFLPENLQNTNATTAQKIAILQQQEINDLKKEIAIYKEILSKKV
jgi:transcriptional regulator with XRE-family HTH domain